MPSRSVRTRGKFGRCLRGYSAGAMRERAAANYLVAHQKASFPPRRVAGRPAFPISILGPYLYTQPPFLVSFFHRLTLATITRPFRRAAREAPRQLARKLAIPRYSFLPVGFEKEKSYKMFLFWQIRGVYLDPGCQRARLQNGESFSGGNAQ